MKEPFNRLVELDVIERGRKQRNQKTITMFMASSAVDLLIGKLVSIIENEASLLGGIIDELDEIKHELVSMKSFLVDADRKNFQMEVEKTWVADVRDIAYEAEDIIDEFMYHMNQQRSGIKLASFLKHTIYLPRNLYVKHQIATKLQNVNRIIKSIPERKQRYGVNSAEEASSCRNDLKWVQKNGESALFLKEDDLVGIEEQRQLLMGWLTDQHVNQTVVSVVGMGGSGKTTLVATTYNNEIVKQHFDCYAWITVSQIYVIEDLLRSLIKEFYLARKEAVPVDLSDKQHKELVQILGDYLQAKRYLVVLDDVWELELWKDIKIALPNTQSGSRVMLTTRKEDIVLSSFGVESHVHHIQPLELDEARDLFHMKAFSNYCDRCCPTELKALALKLVEKCEGLPLAIVALGSLMSSKKTKPEWEIVLSGLNWQLNSNLSLQVVKRVLLLSFNDLPYQLKSCFLYCALFPESYPIQRKRLIRLWMAEGFIEQVKGVMPEQVADSYLMELIFRSMLQVVKRNGSGRPKVCKMHDLMREACFVNIRKRKVLQCI
ncbi:Disease resistance protein [Quillaja saponaria]|uniref:Disease resistance protein n=1 Tax=Quillaja saponaria TaxID=32244 RepID=A0AAD7L1N4_QUISA|nr:Disease resistance protein [Quillaja saponaria]KAJ7949787.1 Disease resistance protein [Quillaja saponaria]